MNSFDDSGFCPSGTGLNRLLECSANHSWIHNQFVNIALNPRTLQCVWIVSAILVLAVLYAAIMPELRERRRRRLTSRFAANPAPTAQLRREVGREANLWSKGAGEPDDWMQQVAHALGFDSVRSWQDLFNANSEQFALLEEQLLVKLAPLPGIKVVDDERWAALDSDPVVTYATYWAQLMQAEMATGGKLADIAQATSNEAAVMDLSGCTAACALVLLVDNWVHGVELRLWHNAKYGVDETKAQGRIVAPFKMGL